MSGDALETAAKTILHYREGFDGIIHLLPFTCMPEIIAQSILRQVGRDHDTPLLSILVDR